MPRRHLLAAAFVAAALVSATPPSARAQDADAATAGVLVDRVAAVVNDRVVTLSEVYERARPLLQRLEQEEGPVTEARRLEVLRQVFRDLVDQQLLEAELAARPEIEVAEAEVDAAIADVRRQTGLSESQFREAVEGQGFGGWDAYRQQFKDQLRRYRLLQREVGTRIEITDADVRTYLSQAGQGPGAEEVRVRHILIRTPDGGSDDEVAAARARAESVLARIRGGEDFAEVARTESEDPAGRDGGDLGWVSRGLMVAPFENAAFAAETGDVVGPVRTRFGWHLIQVVDRRRQEQVDPGLLGEARSRLYEQELARQTRRYLDALRAKAVIEVKVEALAEKS